MTLKEWFAKFYGEHPLPFWGAVIGAAVALLLLIIGFWRTLLIALLAAGGFGIGRLKEQGKSVVQFFYEVYNRVFRR